MSLMWRTTKQLCVTGNKVIMYSGFCVLRVLVDMFERGLYISALVKKREYWPPVIYEYGINAHCEQ